MAEPRYRYRIPPCPAYDIPAMESWLEDMAAEGLHLSKDGFFGLFTTFEEGPPKKERFRLEPTDRRNGLFSEEYDPEDEAVQMLHQMGWTYRARRGQFYIYSTDDPGAPELNTDPQVQALTMAALTKYLWKSLRSTLLLTALYILLYFGDAIITGCIYLGTWRVALLAGLLLWDLGRQIRALVVLLRFRKQLQNGQALPHRSDYRKAKRTYLFGKALRTVLWLVVVFALLGRLMFTLADENYEPLTDRTFPFPTVSDFYPDARVERQHSFMESQFYAWSDPLAPENYDFSEYTQVTLDGKTFDCWLSVHYHRTRWEWTARRLAREFVSQSGANLLEQTAARIFGDEPIVATEIALPGADYCAYFYKYRSNPYIVVQKDNVVIQVSLEIPGGTDPAPEELARMILSQIQ